VPALVDFLASGAALRAPPKIDTRGLGDEKPSASSRHR
jgi:hypothetical protein